MTRPMQDVKVFNVQDRRDRAGTTRPWVVRYSIDGRQRSRSFRTKGEGERFRTLVLRAVAAGERFDSDSGEPEAWSRTGEDWTIYQWVRRWLEQQWQEWQPRTRDSAVEAVSRFVSLAVASNEDAPPTLRRHLCHSLRPDTVVDERLPEQRWIEQHSLPLTELTRVRVGEIDRRLGLGIAGQSLAANTAIRNRSVAHACVGAAVESRLLEADPWPRASRTRLRRKVSRRRRAIETRRLPTPDRMAQAIDAIVSYQPASHRYRAMTAVVYYAGLRPSEVVMLRRRSLELPGDGWGRIDVTEADISFDEPGEPKTGPRVVPIPPILVGILRLWLVFLGSGDEEQFLFRTATGRPPSRSNWARAWRRALNSVGESRIRIYDCRHAAASTWLQAGVPLAETARRLGHTVETLTSTYAGVLQGDEDLGNERIDRVLTNSASSRSAPAP